ncbi:MAG: cytochrome c [Acidimicrobiia bacterium]|nr:cytochrome c [Acidimicrobiia bacterium]
MRRTLKLSTTLVAIPAVLALCASIILLAPASAGAQKEEAMGEHPGFLAAKGRVTFRRYCASCHGPEADGKGNVAQFLKVRPADLRQFLRRYDGEFPRELIFEVVDGRKVVRTHGPRDMPIWGEVFQSPLVDGTAGEESGEDRSNRTIRELVYFIETIQLPVEKPADN